MTDLQETKSLASSFKDFERHIRSIVNSYLYKDMVTALQIEVKSVDGSRGIDDYFRGFIFPPDTNAYVEKFVNAIKFYFSSGINMSEKQKCVARFMSETAKSLSDKEFATWNELEYFLKIPEIRNFQNDDMKKIMDQIELENNASLHGLVKQLLGNDFERVDNSLEDTEYKDLYTLLAEMIKFAKKGSEGILTYWDRSEPFFEGKSIYLNDPANCHNHYGNIVKCTKYTDGIEFQLHDRSMIFVTSEKTVTMRRVHMYKFCASLLNGTLVEGNKFKIEYNGGVCKINPLYYEIELIAVQTDENINDNDRQNHLVGSKEKKSFVDRMKDLKNFMLTRAQVRVLNVSFKSCDATIGYSISIRYTMTDGNTRDSIKKIELKQTYPTTTDSKTHTIAVRDFCDNYNVLIPVEVEVKDINSENIDHQITIKDERDESEVKRLCLKRIQQELLSLRDELVQGNLQLLNLLTDDLITKRLKSIDFEVLLSNNPEFAVKIQNISTDYAEKLDIIYEPVSILQSLVLDANYARMVSKEKSNEVAKTMELLKESDVHIEGIDEKHTVFFMGNTGAGKSTAIGYFLGANLETFTNTVGDKVIKLKKEQEEQYPKIGQSLGRSETLYTSCFPLEDENIALIDCPGFNDTRGGDYEICANMSVDQAVERSYKVISIVVVIPAQTFFSERANGVVDLVQTVQARFPFAFNINSPENSRVFVLITKTSQSQVEPVTHLRAGTRYEILLREARDASSAMKTSENSAGEGEFNSLRYHGMEMRAEMWNAFIKMRHAGQIDFIDTGNKRERTRLLEKYSSGEGIDKDSYIKAMQGTDMMRKFGENIEMSTDTWSKHIINPYLEEFPARIKEKEVEIENGEEKMRNLNKESLELTEAIKNRACTMSQIEMKFGQIEVKDANFTPELQEKFNAMRQDMFSSLDQDLLANAKKVSMVTKNVDELKAEINSNERKKIIAIESITNLKAEIEKLSAGIYKKMLWDEDYRGKENESFTRESYKKNFTMLQRFIARLDERKEGSNKKESTRLYRDYKGDLHRVAEIDRNYCIVPIDASLRQKFQKFAPFESIYNATLEGEHFTVDSGMIHVPTGKSAQYGFKMHFTKGGPMPWINIYHSIPGSEHHSSTIININAEIRALTKRKDELSFSLHGIYPIIGQHKKLKDSIVELRNLTRKQELLKIERDGQEEKFVEYFSATFMESLNESNDLDNKRLNALPLAIESNHMEIAAIKSEVYNLSRLKKNLALIIYNNWKAGKLLWKFAGHVASGAMDVESRTAIVRSCQDFVEVFDKHRDTLFKNCEQELGITQSTNVK